MSHVVADQTCCTGSEAILVYLLVLLAPYCSVLHRILWLRLVIVV